MRVRGGETEAPLAAAEHVLVDEQKRRTPLCLIGQNTQAGMAREAGHGETARGSCCSLVWAQTKCELQALRGSPAHAFRPY